MTMDNAPGNDERRRQADVQMLESLLRHSMRREPEAREARIQGVLQRLDEQTAACTEDNRSSTVQVRKKASRVRRWLSLAVAATLLLAVGLWWQASSSRQALAVVRQSLQWAAETPTRKYGVTAVVHLPVLGRTERVAELYVDRAQRFTIRRPLVLLPGEVWIGGNEQEKWIVPPQGPILVGDEQMLQNWIAHSSDFPTPYLNLTTLLQLMSQRYDLEMLPDTHAALPDQRDQMVRCRRVRGVLRDATWGPPTTIDLWADCDTGIVRRLILDWQLQPGQFGRSKVSIELVGREELPPDWFEHSAHHDDSRLVLRLPP
jgi:hypothetical protein